jgi:hypothetical protein
MSESKLVGTTLTSQRKVMGTALHALYLQPDLTQYER